jgi:hypothetical protein
MLSKREILLWKSYVLKTGHTFSFGNNNAKQAVGV